MAHSRAEITMVGNKYIVLKPQTSMMGATTSLPFGNFLQAYKYACDWVNWDYNYISVKIYPKGIQEAIDRVQKKHQKSIISKKYSTIGECLKHQQVPIVKPNLKQ